jgi:hypothetical protein
MASLLMQKRRISTDPASLLSQVASPTILTLTKISREVYVNAGVHSKAAGSLPQVVALKTLACGLHGMQAEALLLLTSGLHLLLLTSREAFTRQQTCSEESGFAAFPHLRVHK